MGHKWAPILRQGIQGLDLYRFRGTCFPRLFVPLYDLACRQGVQPLFHFVHGQRTEDVGFGETHDQSGWWFSPSEGLETVRALIGGLEKDPGFVRDAPVVMTDLRELESILVAAEQKGVSFYLYDDY